MSRYFEVQNILFNFHLKYNTQKWAHSVSKVQFNKLTLLPSSLDAPKMLTAMVPVPHHIKQLPPPPLIKLRDAACLSVTRHNLPEPTIKNLLVL